VENISKSKLLSLQYQIECNIWDVEEYITKRWKNSKKELSGFVLRGHLFWIDSAWCDKWNVYCENEVSELLSAIGATSFHTHPIDLGGGKETISWLDCTAACAFGHEVVFTAKGVFVLIPYRKMRYSTVERIEDQIDKEVAALKLPKDKAEAECERRARKIFRCHCLTIGGSYVDE
jgi:hypothetical protein